MPVRVTKEPQLGPDHDEPVHLDIRFTQREHARWLVEEKKAGYVFVVKRNQPRLYRQVKALPWTKIPALDETREHGHGRYDIRALQAVTCLGPLALDFRTRFRHCGKG